MSLQGPLVVCNYCRFPAADYAESTTVCMLAQQIMSNYRPCTNPHMYGSCRDLCKDRGILPFICWFSNPCQSTDHAPDLTCVDLVEVCPKTEDFTITSFGVFEKAIFTDALFMLIICAARRVSCRHECMSMPTRKTHQNTRNTTQGSLLLV